MLLSIMKWLRNRYISTILIHADEQDVRLGYGCHQNTMALLLKVHSLTLIGFVCFLTTLANVYHVLSVVGIKCIAQDDI
jgi:hypothetical protein